MFSLHESEKRKTSLEPFWGVLPFEGAPESRFLSTSERTKIQISVGLQEDFSGTILGGPFEGAPESRFFRANLARVFVDRGVQFGLYCK